uniref:RING-type domain-containing protein n=1 Tax=Leersia perrieri TaxID=77586 RepID=A0A0D9VX95_9ORYZ
MAVNAHHLPPIQPSAAVVAGESMFSPRQACFVGAGEVVPGAVMGGICQEQQQVMQAPYAAAAPGAVEVMRQYSQMCAAAESGITFGGAGGGAPAPSRKRKIAEQQPTTLDMSVAAQARQQVVDVDRLVLHHAAKMWAELAEQRRRHARQMVAAVEAAAARRLRAKDEEIERIGRLNWALEERLKGMYVEAQVWRDLAQSNEAAANALRADLDHLLNSQTRHAVAANSHSDAASCCYGDNDVTADDEAASTSACRGCGEAAAAVLMLPCRHLSACEACAAAASACPACGCAKNGSVCVNFS